jgi:hypothetical protein
LQERKKREEREIMGMEGGGEGVGRKGVQRGKRERGRNGKGLKSKGSWQMKFGQGFFLEGVPREKSQVLTGILYQMSW